MNKNKKDNLVQKFQTNRMLLLAKIKVVLTLSTLITSLGMTSYSVNADTSQETSMKVRNTMAKMASKEDTTPPENVTAADFIEIFEKLSGAYPGFRKAHAKGVCAAGKFLPNQNAAYFNDSELLSDESFPVTIRYSLGGGNPNADERVPGVRGTGIQITLPSGAKHNFTGNSAPVFAGKDPETFFGLLKTFLPDASGKPDPRKTGAYIMVNPSTRANARWSQTTPAPVSFANTPYFGLHTFFYTNYANEQLKFRWELQPNLGNKGLSKEQAASMSSEFLADKLKEQVSNPETEVSFTLIANIGKDEDTNIDPSQQWPSDREKVTLGKVVIDSVGSESCNPINFDPNVMSKGFSPSDDPVLRMRSPAYGISFGKRMTNQ